MRKYFSLVSNTFVNDIRRYKLLISVCCILIVFFYSCSNEKEEDKNLSEQIDTLNYNYEVYSIAKTPCELLGYYKSEFDRTISLDSVKGDSIFGHKIYRGDDKYFKGILSKQEGIYSVKAVEDDVFKKAGRLEIEIDTVNNSLTGYWYALDTIASLKKVKLVMNKIPFKYDPNNEYEGAGIYLDHGGPLTGERVTHSAGEVNASNKLLNKEDVHNLYRGDLEVIRNTIYARHGFIFKTEKMETVFFNTNWYWRIYNNVENRLTEIEKKNIDLIKRFEKHAERYYNDGRR